MTSLPVLWEAVEVGVGLDHGEAVAVPAGEGHEAAALPCSEGPESWNHGGPQAQGPRHV